MQLTPRDKRILEAIHAHDGLLSRAQIKRLFFTGDTQLRVRMTLLYQHGYVQRPSRKQRASLPDLIYWLDDKGAALVAGLAGETLETFRYRQEPRWLQVEHDLAVNDVRIAFQQACEQSEGFSLAEWIPEGDFHAYPDRVAYSLPNGTRQSRNVTPDGFCGLSHLGRTFRFLLELDNRTSDNPRFGREKVLPGLAYLASSAYKQRFGVNAGQWLVVTTGKRRLHNLKQQTERIAGKDAQRFSFTTLEAVSAETILTAPIWLKGGEAGFQPLVSASEPIFAATAGWR
ncbi:MAG: replication-relaxation family protein [Anaerolineae bacterium]|nr:replication-relaxation family protein [Anaerolineae bacterium]